MENIYESPPIKAYTPPVDSDWQYSSDISPEDGLLCLNSEKQFEIEPLSWRDDCIIFYKLDGNDGDDIVDTFVTPPLHPKLSRVNFE
jgi:hypothetical protein